MPLKRITQELFTSLHWIAQIFLCRIVIMILPDPNSINLDSQSRFSVNYKYYCCCSLLLMH